ncbi:putative pseudouridylate synthase [Encephalitozoon hellem ATCC 50504]|uniref:tRNA pseudouridine(55) synthase n=1 Tax=Encephalitozoon hellem TaxID=27973 RepID=A0A9Q9C466_ENCHE|nr:putative pseudouridylate synthase [Encephalitozoon hellem ATCC 50504]AFM98850.1 putative pseudouridylate synthase [Encephalitozoon hellem ATCC 50504]UTX43829.1 hypothetical protein GPU96_08g16030 [Encephalitozoon hellem]|eukprot:XP_003887831.1 putative pseudouridylate synthase [Encephalitozoon hellem ATCC 50504]
MNEEQVLCEVRRAVESHQDEMYDNKVYSVSDGGKGKIDKAVVKSKLPQGDWDIPHTEIMIRADDSVKIVIQNSPIYIYGEYVKMDRNMTQSPLVVGGRLKCSRSVSDFKMQVKEFFLADDVVFIPAGREDFDVRMVEGRPFLLTVRNPRRNLNFEKMGLSLYDGLEIKNLCVVKKECKAMIFQGESVSSKTYSVFLCCKKELDLKKDYVIKQRTPLRVLHRRANLTREKKVCILESKKKDVDGWIYYHIVLEASAGTYIKEFVNGDFGRTVPSLGSKENYCDLLELDVLRIEKKSIESFLVRRIELESTKC